MRDLGASPAPMNAYLLNIGIETLPLRMEQHSKNALEVATFLQGHEKVSWVKFPALAGDDQQEKAKNYLPHGCYGVLTFGLKDGKEAAETFMGKTKLISIATHVADAKTCMLHPATTTHRQLTDEQLKSAGIAPELIRLSVGIENVEDIIADLSQALS